MPRNASAKSLEYTSMFSFPRAAFIELLKTSSYDYEKFCKIKDRINIYENRTDLQVLCLSCRSCYHLTKECKYVTYVKPKYNPPMEVTSSNKISNPNIGPTFNKTTVVEKFIRRDRPIINARIDRKEIEEKCEQFYQDNSLLFELESPQLNPETPMLQLNQVSTKMTKVSTYEDIKDDAKMIEIKECEPDSNKNLMSCNVLEGKKLEPDKFYFILEFDKAKNYDFYFTNNNPNVVIKNLKMKQAQILNNNIF